jgi:hypothetical protein
MSRRFVLALLLAALTLTAGCSFLGPTPDNYTSRYDYSVGVDATATLEDVTIRVPVPQTDGEATYDADVVAPNGTVEGVFDATVVETQYGPMLELTAAEFPVETRYYRHVETDGVGRIEEISEAEYDPSNPDHVRRTRRTVSVSVTRSAPYPIETRTPVGQAPTFYEDGAVTRALTTCSLPDRDEATCFAYDAPVYLSYDTDRNATVSGSVVVVGANEWFAGGWTGNGYTDRVGFDASGPQDGWTAANGTTEVGRGNYPSPER